MASPSIPSRGLLLLGLGLLALGATGRPAEAGGLLHKKGQLIAVPTQAAAPVQVLTAIPVQAAPVAVFQVQQAAPIAVSPVQWGVAQPAAQAQVQMQAAPAPSPTIHITVVEAPQAAAAPTAQAQAAPQAAAQVQVAAPAQAVTQAMTTVVPVAAPTVAVPQAVPVQLFYVPPTHKCSIFCKH